jgi:hypothetical protein
MMLRVMSDEAYPSCLSHPQQAFNQMVRLTTLSLEVMPLKMTLTPYFLIHTSKQMDTKHLAVNVGLSNFVCLRL